MPNISKYKIEKYEFNVIVEGGESDGVLITPQEYDLLENPDYISGLQQMTVALTCIRCLDVIESEAAADNELSLIKLMEAEDIEKFLEFGTFARSNPFGELSQRAVIFLKAVNAEWDARKRSGKDKSGYVYLIQSLTGYYKIGRTSDPDQRMKTFSVKLPFEVAYVCLIKTPNMAEYENVLHKKFSHKRVNGEWFKLADEDVELIKSLAVQQ